MADSTTRAAATPQTVSIVGNAFEFGESGISLVSFKNGKRVCVPLTNFDARIATKRTIVIGATEEHEFDLSLRLNGHWHTRTLRPAELCQRDWALNHFGIDAVISSDRDAPDLVRTAIQATSKDAATELALTSTGWFRRNGAWQFAHAGGFISADSNQCLCVAETGTTKPNSLHDLPLLASVPEIPISAEEKQRRERVVVRLPSLYQDYRLPAPPTGKRRTDSLRITLQLLELAPARIMYPLIAAIVWCLIDRPRWSVFLAGLTGSYKTSLALLLGSFVAPGLKEDRLLAWNSTTNAINATLAMGANVPTFVDEFVPHPTLQGLQAASKKADEVLRPAANGTPRQRCNASGHLRDDTKFPQGLVVSTGEQFPSGVSLDARMLAIELEPGDVGFSETDTSALTAAQSHAAEGRYAEFAAVFIQWLAPRLDTVRQELHKASDDFRDLFRSRHLHGRQVDLAADLLAAFDVFNTFMLDEGVLTQTEYDDHWEVFHIAIREQLKRQANRGSELNPVQLYPTLVTQMLLLKRVHVAVLDKQESSVDQVLSPEALGHSRRVAPGEEPVGNQTGSLASGDLPSFLSALNSESSEESGKKPSSTQFIPRGKQIGWKRGNRLYLCPEASLAAVEAFAREIGISGMCLTPKILGKKLRAAGLLVDSSADRNTLKATLEGASVDVFCFALHHFFQVPQDRHEDYIIAASEAEDIAEEEALKEQAERERARDERNRRSTDRLLRKIRLG